MKKYLKKVDKMGVKEFSESDFVGIITIRSDLVCATDKELLDYYKDVSDIEYAFLMNNISNLLDIESGVFAILTDEITNKIYKLINLKRFEIRDTYPEIFDLINEIITKLNKLYSLPASQKAYLRKSYLIGQQELRNLIYLNYESFVESMGVDAILFDYFYDDDTIEGVPSAYLIGSMYFLKDAMPSLFEDENILNKASELITEIENSGQTGISKRRFKTIRKNVLKS